MSGPRELSVALQTDKRPDEYRALAQAVEAFGFDVLSMYSDLTFQPPIVPLTVAALATTRIRLGPASLNPFTLHPVEIAGQIATLDMVSNGRAYLGISRGAWLDAIDVDQDRPISRVIDAFQAVEHLLASEQGAFEGRTFNMNPEIRLSYEPERKRIPMLLGSWGPRLIAAAAQYVDEVKLGGSANPEILPVARRWLGDADCGLVVGAVTIVDEDGALAREAVKREMALYLPVVVPLDPTVEVDPELIERVKRLVREDDVDAAAQQICDELVQKFAFAGTPAEIIEQCQGLFDAGACRIEFGTPHGITAASGLNLLGTTVLPALRGS